MKIKQLTLFTSKIEEQLKFYKNDLDFEIKNYTEHSFEIVAGDSLLRFAYKEHATPYHVAFHIPDRQEETALKWLETKLRALSYNDDKIIDFPNWQAKSLYFYDKDMNIMEFISRRDFSKPESAIFNASSIVGIAEIGMVTGDIESKFKTLKLECGLDLYDGDLERFCAIGESSGLMITINKEKKVWFPTNDKAYSSDFKLEFEHNSKHYKLDFSNDELKISEK